MKLLITCLIAICFSTQMLAQSKTEESIPEPNCYNKWAAKFEERGAEDIADGTHTDVIITIRQGAKADCYSGKADVVEGKVTHFFLLLDDGSYEEVKRNWKNNSNKNVTITNGISNTLITTQNELVNVLWIKKIKPKKSAPKKAPEPIDD